MKSNNKNTEKKSQRQNAADSVNWLISKNPNLKKLIQEFDLQIIVKPKSYNYEN